MLKIEIQRFSSADKSWGGPPNGLSRKIAESSRTCPQSFDRCLQSVVAGVHGALRRVHVVATDLCGVVKQAIAPRRVGSVDTLADVLCTCKTFTFTLSNRCTQACQGATGRGFVRAYES